MECARQVKRSLSASDHVVADCSNLVIYSAFSVLTTGIGKSGKGGNVVFAPVWEPCRKDEQHNSSHVELCLQV